jgi:hypothetical protein
MTDVQPITSNADRRLLFRADGVFRALDGALDAQQRARLEEIPLASTVDVFDSDPPGGAVRRVSPEIRQRLADLAAQGGEPWVDRHMRMVLAMLLVRTLTRAVPYRLVASVDAALTSERLRILDDLQSADSPPYVLGGRLIRDRGFCQGTTLPFDVMSGRVFASVPSHLLTRAGLGHLRESPWINLHLELRPAYPRYSTEARERAHALVADFLRLNPASQGTVGVGWMSDPKALALSPHLGRTIQERLDAGAVILSLGVADEATVKHATGTSRTRRRAYQRGEYTPTDYMMLWPRERLVAWADARRREESRPDS